MDVGTWLDEVGLGLYVQVFADNDIDAETFTSLTNQDLKELGVAFLAYRKKLLAAIESPPPP